MASFIDRLKAIVNKNAQNTNLNYNKAIYNWLGESIVWNTENDNEYYKCFYDMAMNETTTTTYSNDDKKTEEK